MLYATSQHKKTFWTYKKARSSFCSERTASERAMYGEKCFARFRVGMWKIDLHKLSCIYMDLQESGYQY